jgi:AraC-like DNA-binding protein
MIYYIQNMTTRQPDYFVYLPPTPEKALWGFELRGAGLATVHPRAPYPPAGHPEDHLFTWQHGRVLQSFQVVLIAEGGGTLETASAGRQRLEAGHVFLLFPGEWHRYRPTPATGWVENWAELDGPVVRNLIKEGLLKPRAPVLEPGLASGLEETFLEINTLLGGRGQASHAELSLVAHRLIARCGMFAPRRETDSHLARVIRTAERHLAEHCGEALDLQILAGKWGVSYTTFRRAFAAQTGIPPWHYVLRARLARVRRLLAGGEATLDDIATLTGFDSAFHLSAAFKKAYGASPTHWRQKLRAQQRRRPASRG